MTSYRLLVNSALFGELCDIPTLTPLLEVYLCRMSVIWLSWLGVRIGLSL